MSEIFHPSFILHAMLVTKAEHVDLGNEPTQTTERGKVQNHDHH